jgi:hypothetical protein
MNYSPSWYDPYYAPDWYGTGALSDVTPFGALVPPVGISQAFGITLKALPKSWVPGPSKIGPAEVSPSIPSKAEIPWFGIAAIVGVGALGVFLIYSASSAAEKYVGPIHKQAGRATGSMLRARYGKPGPGRLGTGSDVELLPARGDYKLLTA